MRISVDMRVTKCCWTNRAQRRKNEKPSFEGTVFDTMFRFDKYQSVHKNINLMHFNDNICDSFISIQSLFKRFLCVICR